VGALFLAERIILKLQVDEGVIHTLKCSFCGKMGLKMITLPLRCEHDAKDTIGR
jgi:hypothetical protein